MIFYYVFASSQPIRYREPIQHRRFEFIKALMKEIISIHLGQAGVNIGASVWELNCNEHKISINGSLQQPLLSHQNPFAFYQETIKGKLVPRAIFTDLDSQCLDQIKKSSYGKMFNPKYFIGGKQDASSNFVRGYYTVGRNIGDKALQQIRKAFEQSDNPEGCMLYFSISGGSGSGLAARILDRVEDFGAKKQINMQVIFPSPHFSDCIVEPYNSALCINNLFYERAIRSAMVYDNEKLYKYCQNNFNQLEPSFKDINDLIAKNVSALTSSARFKNNSNNFLQNLTTNLIPYPRAIFLQSSFVLKAAKSTFKDDLQNLFEDKYLLNSTSSKQNYFIASQIRVGEQNYQQSIRFLNNYKKDNIKCVDWCQTGLKIQELSSNPHLNRDLCEKNQGLQCSMISNHTSVKKYFKQIMNKFDTMYPKRTFIHWFVGEGLENGQFSSARQNIDFILRDYAEMEKPAASEPQEE